MWKTRWAVQAIATSLLALITLAIPGRESAAYAQTGWRGEYYARPDLVGAPTLVRTDPEINFAWGTGSPDPLLPADHFSVRWTERTYFDAGTYRFVTTSDDGVRLYVDGQLVIDEWQIMSATTYSADVQLAAGNHDIRLEYFEWTGLASVELSWSPVGAPGGTEGEWRGEYFTNPSLSGAPRIVRYDDDVMFEWGAGSPDPAIPTDNFSVRWTQTISFPSDQYQFFVTADDGVRLYVDNQLLIDQWHDTSATTYQAGVTLAEGDHAVRLEYYEHGGVAMAELWWQGVGQRQVGNIITCMRPQNSWIKIYRLRPDDTWEDMNPHGWGPLNKTGYIKIDGLPVNPYFGAAGQPYRVELWAAGSLVRQAGNVDAGQRPLRVKPNQNTRTPWGCPAP